MAYKLETRAGRAISSTGKALVGLGAVAALTSGIEFAAHQPSSNCRLDEKANSVCTSYKPTRNERNLERGWFGAAVMLGIAGIATGFMAEPVDKKGVLHREIANADPDVELQRMEATE